MDDTRDSTQRPKYELGVLFVHGIGEQRAGGTLASFASALFAWLFHWNCPTRDRLSLAPRLSDTVLRPSPEGQDGPANATLSVPLALAGEEKAREAQWLLAESWWAESFDAPKFWDMARWFWKVSTCLLVLQFVIPYRRHRWQARNPDLGPARPESAGANRRPSRLMSLVYPGLMVLAAPVSVLLALLLLGLAVAAELPIPRIERAVQRVVVKLSAVVGDSYVLVHCPVQYAAMRTQVARDLAWLQARSERVAVVAHSQGAAIAHQVLKDNEHCRQRLRTFVTLGQGISKLHMLQRFDWDPDMTRKAAWTRFCVCGGLVVAGLPLLSLIVSRWVPWAPLVWLTGLWAALALLMIGLAAIRWGVRIATRALDDRIGEDFCLPGAGTAFRWADYYASADPVSNGPLAGFEQGSQNRGQRRAYSDTHPLPCDEVYNHASLLSDHTGYLRNQDQFLSQLVNDLVAAAYGSAITRAPIPSLVPQRRLAKVRLARRRRLRWLIAGRFLALPLGFLGSWLLPARLLGRPLNWSMRQVASHATIGALPARYIAMLAIAVLVYFILIFPLWYLLERRAVKRFFIAGPLGRDQAGGPPDRSETELLPRDRTLEEPAVT